LPSDRCARQNTSAVRYGPERCPTCRSPFVVGGVAVTRKRRVAPVSITMRRTQPPSRGTHVERLRLRGVDKLVAGPGRHDAHVARRHRLACVVDDHRPVTGDDEKMLVLVVGVRLGRAAGGTWAKPRPLSEDPECCQGRMRRNAQPYS
jgi:hypothetical protein